ncbi:MAG: aminoacyl-tRNA hydrolase, partial [bacterium]
MRLIVGLGNFGAEYEGTRHNVGFRVVTELASRLDLSFVKSGPNYREATGETRFGELVLLKPMTYMNRSGNALRAWAARTGNRLA